MKETLDHSRWKQNIINEMQALKCNGTWDFSSFTWSEGC